MRHVIGRPALLREHNRALILSALRGAESLSRADLARSTGLAVPTVSRLVEELVGQGLIEELGSAASRGGRPATLLRLRADGACVLGADLGRTGIRVVLADLRANVLGEAEAEHAGDPDTDIRTVADEAGRLLAELRLDRARVIGLGIGVPGPLDTEQGLVLGPPNMPGWSFVPIRDRLTALLGMPVVVDNNINVAAYGEYLFRHHDVRTMVYVHASRGIGAGIVLDGHLYRGRANAVGEIGHCAIDPDGPTCSCGQSGCLEALAGTDAMLAAYRRELAARDVLDFRDVLGAETAGEQGAVRVLTGGGEALGIGLATLVNLLDPELLVLGGPATASETYREVAVNELRTRTFVRSESDIRVEQAGLGERAVALGAAAVLLHRLFSVPSVMAHRELISNS